MFKIVKDLSAKNKYYKAVHPTCCEFEFSGDEVQTYKDPVTAEITHYVLCPQCGMYVREEYFEKITAKEFKAKN